ncbi:MAG: hypothetical protein IT426_10640 [Pirellulales bacterium]|nr:hypothetical protein [Pirellulales bacterium]
MFPLHFLRDTRRRIDGKRQRFFKRAAEDAGGLIWPLVCSRAWRAKAELAA